MMKEKCVDACREIARVAMLQDGLGGEYEAGRYDGASECAEQIEAIEALDGSYELSVLHEVRAQVLALQDLFAECAAKQARIVELMQELPSSIGGTKTARRARRGAQ